VLQYDTDCAPPSEHRRCIVVVGLRLPPDTLRTVLTVLPSVPQYHVGSPLVLCRWCSTTRTSSMRSTTTTRRAPPSPAQPPSSSTSQMCRWAPPPLVLWVTINGNVAAIVGSCHYSYLPQVTGVQAQVSAALAPSHSKAELGGLACTGDAATFLWQLPPLHASPAPMTSRWDPPLLQDLCSSPLGGVHG
jgi:hypothetical protein